jgi:hypothetical protein
MYDCHAGRAPLVQKPSSCLTGRGALANRARCCMAGRWALVEEPNCCRGGIHSPTAGGGALIEEQNCCRAGGGGLVEERETHVLVLLLLLRLGLRLLGPRGGSRSPGRSLRNRRRGHHEGRGIRQERLDLFMGTPHGIIARCAVQAIPQEQASSSSWNQIWQLGMAKLKGLGWGHVQSWKGEWELMNQECTIDHRAGLLNGGLKACKQI